MKEVKRRRQTPFHPCSRHRSFCRLFNHCIAARDWPRGLLGDAYRNVWVRSEPEAIRTEKSTATRPRRACSASMTLFSTFARSALVCVPGVNDTEAHCHHPAEPESDSESESESDFDFDFAGTAGVAALRHWSPR